jgi:fluoroquinolone transport system permease protein
MMTASQRFRALGKGDARSIARDSFLVFLLIFPLAMALIMRFLLPPVAARLADRVAIVPYYPLILAYTFLLTLPLMFGVLVGLMLLDERDDDTLTALQVTPLSTRSYLSYRLFFPYLLAMIYAVVLMAIIGLHEPPFWPVIPVAAVAAMAAPFFSLFMSTFAGNKVEGLAVMKGAGIFLIAPVIDWFVDAAWTPLLGIFPTYWPVTAYWMAVDGETGQRFWTYLLVGVVFQVLVTLWLVRRFTRVIQR